MTTETKFQVYVSRQNRIDHAPKQKTGLHRKCAVLNMGHTHRNP